MGDDNEPDSVHTSPSYCSSSLDESVVGMRQLDNNYVVPPSDYIGKYSTQEVQWEQKPQRFDSGVNIRMQDPNVLYSKQGTSDISPMAKAKIRFLEFWQMLPGKAASTARTLYEASAGIPVNEPAKQYL